MDHGRQSDEPWGTDPTAAGALGDGAGLVGDDRFGRALARWAAEAVVDEAVSARIRVHWLRVQSEEESSLAGTVVGLAERRRPVVVDVGDHRYQGRVVGVAADFLALRTDQGQHVLVVLDAIDAVRAEPGSDDLHGTGRVTVDAELAGVLGPLAAERPDVVVRTRGTATVRGQLRSAGVDVVSVRADGDPPTPVWVPIAAVAAIVIDP